MASLSDIFSEFYNYGGGNFISYNLKIPDGFCDFSFCDGVRQQRMQMRTNCTFDFFFHFHSLFFCFFFLSTTWHLPCLTDIGTHKANASSPRLPWFFPRNAILKQVQIEKKVKEIMLMLVPYLEQCMKLSNLAVPQVEHISHLSLHHLLGTLQTLTHAKKSVILQPVVGLGCVPLQWRHNERDGVSNHQHHDCLLNRLYRRRSKKTSKLRVTGLCVGDSLVTGEFPAPRASNAEKVSIWWRHYDWGW